MFDATGACRWRAVLVDDGSRDRSAELVARSRGDPRWNRRAHAQFRLQSALSAGLVHAREATRW